MADKETVVVEKGDHREERRSSGWIGLVIAIVLLLLFLAFGGLNMFNGGQTTNDGTGAPATDQPTTTPAPTTPTTEQ